MLDRKGESTTFLQKEPTLRPKPERPLAQTGVGCEVGKLASHTWQGLEKYHPAGRARAAPQLLQLCKDEKHSACTQSRFYNSQGRTSIPGACSRAGLPPRERGRDLAGARKCEPTGGRREGPLAGASYNLQRKGVQECKTAMSPWRDNAAGVLRAWVGGTRYMDGFLYHPGSQEFSP